MADAAKTLRKLAYKYSEIANSQENLSNMNLHKSVNDLKQNRPVVLIEELPWHDMNIDDELTLRCKDEFLRSIELYLRKSIYKHKYMPADMVVLPFVPVNKIIESTGIGVSVKEDTLAFDKENHIVAHQYHDILSTPEDLKKIHNPIITYNETETLMRYNLVGDIIGDIIPIKLTGAAGFFSSAWDLVSKLRGVTSLLLDLADRPNFMHKMIRKLNDTKLSELKQYEDLGLFDSKTYMIHCTPGLTDDLPGDDFDGLNVTRKDIWGRGAAQIFASVSKKMHNEFDVDYMIDTIGQCGLAYYGCCEPLDKKIDIVEKIPNLRKISITPWADVNVAAEAIGKRYVLSSKPNPAAVAVSNLDKDYLKKEIGEILDACIKNNCNVDIVLKDISSCGKRPENIFKWEKIVMDMLKNY